jgi:hypothetical protein
MGNTIQLTGTALSITPYIITDYNYTVPTRNIVHEILNRTAPVVTLAPASTRTGTLNIFCATYAEAIAARDLHTKAGTFSWTTTDFTPAATMYYVVSGAVTVAQDSADVTRWMVNVEYKEVTL